MTAERDPNLGFGIRRPVATPKQVAAEPVPFPQKTAALAQESFFADWRDRLARNTARRSDSRWEPLTWVHAADAPPEPPVTDRY